MSYADVAAKGPKQSNEEKPTRVPPHVPEIMHEDSGVHSLESLESQNDHVQSLPSIASYADQQLAEERAEEARREGKKAADEISKEAKDFMQHAEEDAKRLEKDASGKAQSYGKAAEKKFEQFKGEAKEVKDQAGKTLRNDAEAAKKNAKKAEEWGEKNKNNPVVIGNAVVIAALGALLGSGAYKMHKTNTLTWNVVGAWAGAVGLFAVGDYYVSQYFFKKYPPKN
ncbi:transport BET1 [Lecanosticta acicola]|uniref:Transport BET1 n=1 Tax=Lecanosticta acicola TaxID=111012 RepID=A0AAI8Z7I9_9PEZI|nr:transport BET1 [Lecanosticta acicola]